MFCQYCGSALDEGARFCKACGNAVPAAASAPAIAARIAPADPAQVFRHHIRVLGIVWLAYSIFRIIMSIWIQVFSHYFLPVMQDLMSRGDASLPFSIVHFLQVIYAISSAFGIAAGILGVVAGAMLLQRKPAARLLVIIAAFLSVLSFPIGTAVAAYTLILLMPQDAARNYQQLAATA
jgi:hypothetical protein